MECFVNMWCTFVPPAPGGGVCPDAVLPTVLPVNFAGDTTGLGDDHITFFGAFNEPHEDARLEFTAPSAQVYALTVTAAFAPYLFVLDGCAGERLGESTQSKGPGTAAMNISLNAGQTVIIGIESFSVASGAFTLDIADGGPDIGGTECCGPQAGTGCAVQAVEDCVCADIYCCNTLWDGICGYRARECGADCT
jgi:hypothetical protein